MAGGDAFWFPVGGGGGGGAVPVMVTAIGDGSGNHVHSGTATTFTDIHASMYDCVVPAVAGDALLITFECQWFQTKVSGQCRIRFTVAGTAIAAMPTLGLLVSAHSSGSHFNAFSWTYTVQPGDISGGFVTVRPQYGTNSDTLSIRNDGVYGLPFMRVLNMLQ